MKEEQIKALFMAQYLGQDIYANVERDLITYVTTEYIQDAIKGRRDTDYLLLRSVNDLTDEEKHHITMVEHNYNATKFRNETLSDGNVHGWLAFNKSIINCVVILETLSFRSNDFLIRKGYLRPFTYIDESGKPITLTPDDIIQRGWAKYQTK